MNNEYTYENIFSAVKYALNQMSKEEISNLSFFKQNWKKAE